MTDKKLHKKHRKAHKKFTQQDLKPSQAKICWHAFTVENKDTCNKIEKHNFVSGHR
jgi:hypothetical protein